MAFVRSIAFFSTKSDLRGAEDLLPERYSWNCTSRVRACVRVCNSNSLGFFILVLFHYDFFPPIILISFKCGLAIFYIFKNA